MKLHLLKAVCICVFMLTSITTAQAAPVSGQGTWETTLQGRDLDGDLSTAEAYYDITLDVTWLADANYSATQFVNSGGVIGDADGTMSWIDAKGCPGT